VGELLWSVQNFELLISSDLYVLRSPEHVHEVFRMMSVCVSVCLSVHLVLSRLLKNALTDCFQTWPTQTYPWSLELKSFWCQSDHGGWKRVGVGRKNNKGTWKFDFTVWRGMCFYVGNDVYHLRIFPIWRTYKLIYVFIDRPPNRVWGQSDYEGWKRVGVARKNHELTLPVEKACVFMLEMIFTICENYKTTFVG
jgi:hypothetical protein